MLYAIYKVLRSFTYAFAGLFHAFGERNMRVHGIAAIAVLCLSLFLQISVQEWLWVMTMIGAVFSAEIFNTALEDMCNVMRDDLGASYKSTGKARDMAAAAVLVVAIVAAVGGCVIFLPKILVLLG